MASGVVDVREIQAPRSERIAERGWSTIARALMAAVVVYLGQDALFNREFLKNISDGVGYLDISHAVANGRFQALLNAYWSPGYPVALTLGLGLMRPSPARELAAVYAIHAVIGLFALCCLLYFVWGLPEASVRPGRFGLTRPMLAAAACGLLLISLQSDMPVYMLTPDLLLAGLLWLGGGLFLRIARSQRMYHYGLLAVALALGYFTKAVALSLALAAPAILPFTGADRRRARCGTLLYIAVAAVVISPYVAKLSAAKGRFTFGESGSLNYAWIVDGADGPNRWHLQDDSDHGQARMKLTHPAPRVMTSPDVYLYPGPVQGSFPVFDDPSYWDDGLKPAFYLKGQAWHIAMNLFHTVEWLGKRAWFSVALLLMLVVQLRCGTKARLRGVLPVLFWYACMWGLYLLVDVESRYIFGVGTAMLLLVAATVRLPDTEMLRKAVSACLLIVVLGAGVQGLNAAAGQVYAGLRQVYVGKFRETRAIGPFGNPYWEIARTLNERLGLKPNDQVACMQTGCDLTYWASLAGVRIVADVSREDDYWAMPSENRAKAMSLLAQSGVKAIVTRHLGPGAESEGWIALNDPHEKPEQGLFARVVR